MLIIILILLSIFFAVMIYALDYKYRKNIKKDEFFCGYKINGKFNDSDISINKIDFRIIDF